jgi:hypothetical protein
MVAAARRSELVHSAHRSRAVGQLHPQRSRSWFPQKVGSLAQALKNGEKQLRIYTALRSDQRSTRKLDMNRTASGPVLCCAPSMLLFPRLGRRGNNHREQGGRTTSGLRQLASLESATPAKHLVRVHPVAQCNLRHAGTWFEGLLDYPPLLRHRTPLPAALPATHILSLDHAPILT